MKKRIFGNNAPEVSALGLSCMSLSYGGLRKKDHHLADLFLGANLSRRTALGASALLLLGAALPGAAKGDIMNRGTSLNTLVVYFSRSGNTRVIAGTIQRALTADTFEIKPAAPYPEDYNATVEQARIERDEGLEPLLAGKVENMGHYETIYLGFPIWGETAPPVIRSFLRTNNLQGKTVRPFITHAAMVSATACPSSLLMHLARASSLSSRWRRTRRSKRLLRLVGGSSGLRCADTLRRDKKENRTTISPAREKCP